VIRVAVVGAAGYIGGELLRLLITHPKIEVVGAVSSRFPGKRVDGVHPNLRSHTDLLFCTADEVDDCDIIFLATPHRAAMTQIDHWTMKAKQVIDLTGDFRLDDTQAYRRYYGEAHAAPHLLDEFVPGIPELYRGRPARRRPDQRAGCMALAGVLALYPLVSRDLVEETAQFDARTGSSGFRRDGGRGQPARRTQRRDAGVRADRAPARGGDLPAPRHPGHHDRDRSRGGARRADQSATPNCARVSRIDRAEGVPRAVRGRAVRPADRPAARRLPLPGAEDPAGSNFCDVGYAVDEEDGRLVTIAALDNLMKGGAGNAIQCLNIRMGWPESLGLSFPGLHPV